MSAAKTNSHEFFFFLLHHLIGCRMYSVCCLNNNEIEHLRRCAASVCGTNATLRSRLRYVSDTNVHYFEYVNIKIWDLCHWPLLVGFYLWWLNEVYVPWPHHHNESVSLFSLKIISNNNNNDDEAHSVNCNLVIYLNERDVHGIKTKCHHRSSLAGWRANNWDIQHRFFA